MHAMTTRYTVKTIRSGQPRAYADSEYECLITVEIETAEGFKPWIPGFRPEYLQEWAKQVVKSLFRRFSEPGDALQGMDAMMAAKLESISIDADAGTIRAVIREPYND